MTLWGRAVGSRPIVTRLVLTVAVAMTIVLALGSAFVFWRVRDALDRQLARDLAAYREVAETAVVGGRPLVRDTPGLSYQVYDADGRVVSGDADQRIVDAATVHRVFEHGTASGKVGRLFPVDPRPYQYIVARVRAPSGPVVVAYAISRTNHDQALRELLVQLLIADAVTLAAASFVGYRTARGALDPVEQFRVVAATAGEADRLPVGDRDDEIGRLGHTFNDLLDRIATSVDRERQFLADASHELRGPLTVMRTEVEWARLRPDDPTATSETVASLGRQVDRMVALCNTLLDLEEMRADSHAPTGLVDVAELVASVVERWSGRTDDRVIVVAVEDGLALRGDAHWLDLALDNLVSNALRYGAGEIRVGAVGIDPGHLEIHVEDDGAGFPDWFAARAFDRFARADESRSSGGTGLGLALVAAVAETHGGTAEIAGSRVTVRVATGG